VTPHAVHLAIPLRKNEPILAPHTLTYRMADTATPTPIDHITRYQNIRSGLGFAQYFLWYWAW
jgi:hypothetical protein